MKRKLPKGYRIFFSYRQEEMIFILANKKDGSALFIFDGISTMPIEIHKNYFRYKKVK